MKIYDLLDLSELERQIGAGLISSRPHPKFPLSVLNYTQRATFDIAPQDWNENLRLARGLIYNTETQEIVARGFRKFWGYGDDRIPETIPENLPAGRPEITTKMDGSLGIYYEYDGQIGIATRGSFTSEQALWAAKWFAKHGSSPHGTDWWQRWTPLFEIVYPENTVVVQGQPTGLHLLAAVNKSTGEELGRPLLQALSAITNVPLVDSHNKSLDSCLADEQENFEGYVATWHIGHRAPVKVKIKLAEYKRLARLYSGISPKEIWRMLAEGESFSKLIANSPQPYVEWVLGWRDKLEQEFTTINLAVEMQWKGLCVAVTPGSTERDTRKAYASYFSQTPKLAPVLFAMLDNDEKKKTEIIWKMVKELTAGRPVYKPEAAEA